MNLCKDPALMPDPEGIAKALRAPLLKSFPPALLGRLVAIPYYPLSDTVLGKIIRLQLGRIVARIQGNHGAKLEYGDDVVKLVAARCTEPESGGRMIDAIVTNTLLPAISRELLNRIATGQSTRQIGVSVADGDFHYSFE
jgi:type VI secretion system protein VasG